MTTIAFSGPIDLDHEPHVDQDTDRDTAHDTDAPRLPKALSGHRRALVRTALVLAVLGALGLALQTGALDRGIEAGSLARTSTEPPESLALIALPPTTVSATAETAVAEAAPEAPAPRGRPAKAAAACPASWTKALARGDRHFDAGRSAKAVRFYKKAVRACRTDARGWAALGRAYHDLGKNALARRILAKALRLDPRSHMAHLVMGSVYQALGHEAAAARYYEAYAALAPKGPNVHDAVYLAGRMFDITTTLPPSEHLAPTPESLVR